MTTEDRLAALEAKVQHLTDIEDVRAVRLAYHTYVNEKRPDELTDLYTDDATIDFGYLGVATGREQIKKYWTHLTSLLPFLRQFIHNQVVTIDGDTAHGVSDLEAKSISEGVAYRICGRYHDDYVRTPSGWKFQTMRFEYTYTIPADQTWNQDNLNQMGRAAVERVQAAKTS